MVVVGAAKSSIVQIHSAAIGSASMCGTSACTANVCSPAMRPLASKSSSSVYVFCDSQATGTEPSMEHWKTTSGVVDENANVGPGWFAWKVNVAELMSVSAAGKVRIVDSGGGVTCQLRTAGVVSMLPATSIARTRSWCTPTAKSMSCNGEMHALNAAPSSEQRKVAPSSLEENTKLALVNCVIVGGVALMVVSGDVVSTIVQTQAAGVGSMLPETSTVRTSNVCRPAPRPE